MSSEAEDKKPVPFFDCFFGNNIADCLSGANKTSPLALYRGVESVLKGEPLRIYWENEGCAWER